jgi:hypothetical protein
VIDPLVVDRAGLIVELVFQGLGLLRTERDAKIEMAGINYTTVLNIIFLALAAVLVWRFVRTGEMPMLRMMNKPMPSTGAASYE